MRNNLKVLFLDDNDLDSEIESLNKSLQKQGMALISYYVNISDPKYKREVVKGGDKRLTKELIVEEIYNLGLMDIDIDIVACDFNFSDPYVNGYELLTDLIGKAKNNRNKIRKAKLVFYTGQVKELKEVVIKDMRKFLNLKIDSIVDRTQLTERILRLCNIINQELDLENIFLTHLESHKDRIFKNTYPNFQNKKIENIITEIEKETSHGKGYLNFLVEQTIAHMIELQGK